MFTIFEILLGTTFCIYFAQCGTLSPCRKNDAVCFESSIKKALPQFLSENKTLGVESSDPLKIDRVDGDLAGLKFSLFTPVTKGFKQCVIEDVKINLDAMTLHFKLNCPSLEARGEYNLSGRLIILPVEGNGAFLLATGSYSITVDSDLKTAQGDDNRQYLAIKSFKLKNEPKDPIHFDFKNLFNGQKELADGVLKYANENWKDVADLLQEPVIYPSIKKIISNINKYLKTQPIDEIFIP